MEAAGEDGKHWFLWLRLQELSREAAAAYWSHSTLKMLHQPQIRGKTHSPSPLFYVRGGRTQMPVWIMIWNRLFTDLLLYEGDDYIAETSEIECRWQLKRGLSVLLRRDWTEKYSKEERRGLENPTCWKTKIRPIHADTHTHMHTHKHTPNLQEVRASALKARRANIVRCTPARTSKCIHTHCLSTHDCFSQQYSIHHLFPPLYMLIEHRNRQKKPKSK